MRLKGKKILVTAAGQGIGRAAVIALAREGAEVMATDRDPRLLEGLSGMETATLDVTDEAGVQAMAARLGRLDGLFSCAGWVVPDTAVTITDAHWARTFDINVTGTMRLARAFLPGMLERAAEVGTASLLNMASMASSKKGFPNRASYGASKAAVIGLTKAIAADYVRTGLRANALCPGTVDSPSLRERIAAFPDPVQAEKDFIARQPMGRLGSVEDMAGMIVYLLSDESRYMTGQAVAVDGGTSI